MISYAERFERLQQIQTSSGSTLDHVTGPPRAARRQPTPHAEGTDRGPTDTVETAATQALDSDPRGGSRWHRASSALGGRGSGRGASVGEAGRRGPARLSADAEEPAMGDDYDCQLVDGRPRDLSGTPSQRSRERRQPSPLQSFTLSLHNSPRGMPLTARSRKQFASPQRPPDPTRSFPSALPPADASGLGVRSVPRTASALRAYRGHSPTPAQGEQSQGAAKKALAARAGEREDGVHASVAAPSPRRVEHVGGDSGAAARRGEPATPTRALRLAEAERDAAIRLLRQFKKEGDGVVQHLYDAVKAREVQSVQLRATVDALRRECEQLRAGREAGGGKDSRGGGGWPEPRGVGGPRHSISSGGASSDSVVASIRTEGAAAEPSLEATLRARDRTIAEMSQLLAQADETMRALRRRVEVAEGQKRALLTRAATSSQSFLGHTNPPRTAGVGVGGRGGRGGGAAAESGGEAEDTRAVGEKGTTLTEVEEELPLALRRLHARLPGDADVASVRDLLRAARTRITELQAALKAEAEGRMQVELLSLRTAREHERTIALLEQRLRQAQRARGLAVSVSDTHMGQQGQGGREGTRGARAPHSAAGQPAMADVEASYTTVDAAGLAREEAEEEGALTIVTTSGGHAGEQTGSENSGPGGGTAASTRDEGCELERAGAGAAAAAAAAVEVGSAASPVRLPSRTPSMSEKQGHTPRSHRGHPQHVAGEAAGLLDEGIPTTPSPSPPRPSTRPVDNPHSGVVVVASTPTTPIAPTSWVAAPPVSASPVSAVLPRPARAGIDGDGVRHAQTYVGQRSGSRGGGWKVGEEEERADAGAAASAPPLSIPTPRAPHAADGSPSSRRLVLHGSPTPHSNDE